MTPGGRVTMAVMPRRYRFTVDEYERLAEAGLPAHCDRVELLDGEIVEMTPIGTRHASVVSRVSSVFSQRLGSEAILWGQNPIALVAVRSMPQPDVALLRPRADFYASRRPVPDDVLLLIEVIDTSGPTDRGVKLPLYAKAGIRETWLVDVNGWRIEVFRQPSTSGYTESLVLRPGDIATPLSFPDLHLAVTELLGDPA
jgi:Uma2 family endonuclease